MTSETAHLARYERWLAALPRGLASYPEALAKGSLARSVLEGREAGELAARLPDPLRRYVTDPPMSGEWLPEAHVTGLILAIADLHGMTEAEVCTWARLQNRALFSSAAYRILMAVVSPGSMVRFAARRWENWHRGTTLEVGGITHDGVRLTMRFPVGLFDGLVLRAFAGAFAAALEMAHAASPEVRLEAEGPGRASFVARW